MFNLGRKNSITKNRVVGARDEEIATEIIYRQNEKRRVNYHARRWASILASRSFFRLRLRQHNYDSISHARIDSCTSLIFKGNFPSSRSNFRVQPENSSFELEISHMAVN